MSLKARIARPIRALQQHARWWAFDRAFRQFRRRPTPALLPLLSRTWGNAAWSPSPQFLTMAMDQAVRVGGPILECGSGLSTLILASALEFGRRRRTLLWSLEHLDAWGDRVSWWAWRYGLHSVNVFVDPLRDYGDFTWYDDRLPDRRPIDLVLCDGPPSGVPGGRFGLLPVMRTKLAAGCTILLDDLVRLDEQVIMARWAKEYDVQGIITGSPAFAILKVPAHVNWPSAVMA